MANTPLEASYSRWIRLLSRTNDEAFDAREAAERVILDHRPACAADAVKIVHVLKKNLEAGPREDGRDVRALNRLQNWLKPQTATQPA